MRKINERNWENSVAVYHHRMHSKNRKSYAALYADARSRGSARLCAAGLGALGLMSLATAPARAQSTMLFTTSSDFTGWTGGNDGNANPITAASSTAYDFDGSTVNGAGNNPGNSGSSINVGGSSTGGSLQLTDTESNNPGSSLGYSTLAYSPGEAYNSAFMTAIDPGSTAAYSAASSYGPGTTLAYSGTLQLTYTVPTISAGSYLQVGVNLAYDGDGYYGTFFPTASAASDGTVDGLHTYTETIPYSINAGALNGFGLGIQTNTDYVPTSPFYVDSIEVVTPAVFSAVNANWTYNGNGAWETNSNWNPSAPGVAGSTATFDNEGGTITVNPTVTLSSNITLDNINFNTSAVSYTINGSGGSITLDTSTGNQVNVYAGSHTINAPVIMAGSTTFTVNSGSSLTVPNLSGGGYGNVTLAGGGALTTGLLQNVTLLVNGGTYNMQNGVDNDGFLYGITVAAGATFNVGSNNLVYNNTLSGNGIVILGPGSTLFTGLYGGDTFFGTVQGSGNIQIGSNITGTANVVSFQGSNTFTGPYTVAGGGTFEIAAAANIGAGGATNTVTLDNGTLQALASFTATQALLVTANGGTLNTGGFNVSLGSISGPGTLTVTGGSTVTIAPQTPGGGLRTLKLDGLNITSGEVSFGTAALHSDKTVLVTGGLSLSGATGAWTSTLDLGGNDMIVQNGDLATITNQVQQGFAGGTWQGSGGILSAAAAANSRHLTALGVIQNSVDGTPSGSTLYATFDGTASSDADVLVKYTYYGDATLQGSVSATDYSRIDNGYLNHLTGWYNGDFNYDGVVNGSDYTLIDNAYNSQGAQLSAEVASATAQIAGGGSVAVPEPATLGIVTISALSLLGRRRRVG
jgi:hypothetical protein